MATHKEKNLHLQESLDNLSALFAYKVKECEKAYYLSIYLSINLSIYISNIYVLNTAVSTMVVKQIHLMSTAIQIVKCHATAKLKTINSDYIKGGPGPTNCW